MHLADRIRANLSDDLRRAPWRGSTCPVAGHCYVASEAAFHVLGGRGGGWKPETVTHEGAVHWYLRHATGQVLDVTAAQFTAPPDYTQGRGRAFLTRRPSRRARELLHRIGEA